MTQLVQLQQALPELQDAGYEVFAISNDTVERLADFACKHGITFPLLADEDSAVIRAFGIMNQLIQPDEGKHMRWYGIPYPGTYIADPSGRIIDKEFHQHHARRMSGPALLHRIRGDVPAAEPDAVLVDFADDDVSMSTYLLDPTLRLEVITTLVCKLKIAPGRHLYAEGAPDEFTPAVLTLEGQGIRFGEPVWPPPQTLAMSELGISVPVYAGEITVTVPVTVTSEIMRLGHGLDQDTADLRIVCTYQACDAHTCGLPTDIEVCLTVPLEPLVEPDGVRTYIERLNKQA
jgi:hypothetical protein